MNELELKTKVSSIEEAATQITVTDDESFQNASEFLRNIKRTTKNITDFFKDIKTNAHASWKAICAKENDLKSPLTAAEKIVKSKATAYQIEQEKIRQEQERVKAEQEREIERIKQEAIDLANKGKKEEAEDVYFDAILEEAAIAPVSEKPKAEGISFKIDYELSVVDESIVPCRVGAQIIRPVDLGAIKRLVKISEGNIEIPGIKIKETKTMAVRR